MSVTDGSRIRVQILSASDGGGGACRAASRLHQALRSNTEIASTMLVSRRLSDSPYVTCVHAGATRKIFRKLVRTFSRALLKRQHAPVNINSLALVPSGLRRHLGDGPQVTHLHWINADMASIAEIGRLPQPIAWTLHDTWPFCGSEHYPYGLEDRRFAAGYTPASRPHGHSGLDLDRWTWRRKKRHWRNPIFLICPSHWMQSCVRESPLLCSWPSAVIPNALDTDIYKPLDKTFCRQALGLPEDSAIVLFGAVRATSDPRKGFDLLLDGIRRLASLPGERPLECVVFGQGQPADPPPIPVKVHWMGPIGDDWTLALLYNAADVFVLPSRQENLPQTATEAQSCGCPVVAFDVCGMPDAVAHGVSGYLAAPYDTAEFAHAIARLLNDSEWAAQLAAAGRERALRLWSHPAVIPQHLDVYRSLFRSAAKGLNA